MLVKLIPSKNKNKKWTAIFSNHQPVDFGAYGYEDYTTHRDPERKKKYIQRHRAREDWANPYKPGTLSRYLLWEYENLEQAIREYNRRFFRNTEKLK
jgi:hypothetical protein